jgi:hypothetical protein
MVAVRHARKSLGIIFSCDLQNITHEWPTKFYPIAIQQLQINVNVTQQ